MLILQDNYFDNKLKSRLIFFTMVATSNLPQNHFQYKSFVFNNIIFQLIFAGLLIAILVITNSSFYNNLLYPYSLEEIANPAATLIRNIELIIFTLISVSIIVFYVRSLVNSKINFNKSFKLRAFFLCLVICPILFFISVILALGNDGSNESSLAFNLLYGASFLLFPVISFVNDVTEYYKLKKIEKSPSSN